MEADTPHALLRTILSSNDHSIDACLYRDISVICINKITKKSKLMSFKILYENNNKFWLQNETWEYFLAHSDIDKVNEQLALLNEQWEPGRIEAVQDNPKIENQAAAADGWGKEYEEYAAIPEPERLKRMQAGRERLDALIDQKPRQEELITEALVETTQDAVLHNYASIMDVMSLSGEEAKKHTQGLVESTRELIKSSSQLISSHIFSDELMQTLVSKSNGTIIQHMTRVYLKGLAFLSYYNNLVSSSSIIHKYRIAFNTDYHEFYHGLLPHVYPEDLTLQKVFHGGMRAIPEAYFYNWAIGFLVHDIGKAAAVEYHEGEDAYNRNIVIEHVNVGYTSIINKTNYPRDAAFITGYHHEYYGDPAGYGYYRTFLENYKKMNPNAKMESCISYEIEPVIDCETLAYFPAKLLEIIDVYDSLTDPSRKYKKAMTTEEAVTVMKDEFIIKHRKLDPVLFDLFVKFIDESVSSS